MRRCGAALLAISLLVGPSINADFAPVFSAAHADEDPAVAKAREDWNEGMAFLTGKNYAAALAKFKAVARVRMSAQVAFNIAECEENLGKLVSALGNYRLALAKAEEANVAVVLENAPARIERIESRIAKLTILRKEEKPNPTATVELDGVEISSNQIGVALNVDPGERTIRVMIDGNPVVTERVKLGDGEVKTVEIKIPEPEVGNKVVNPSDPTAKAEGSGGPSIPGIALAVFGGAAIIGGFAAIGVRQAALSDLDELCGGDTSCPNTEDANSAYDRGRLATGFAEVLFPVGAVSAVVGIILIATMSGDSAPADEKKEPEKTALRWISPTAPDGNGPGISVAIGF